MQQPAQPVAPNPAQPAAAVAVPAVPPPVQPVAPVVAAVAAAAAAQQLHSPGNDVDPSGGNGGVNANGAPSSFYQAWSRSYVEMYTISHEWTIDNFIELDEEATVIFKVVVNEHTTPGNGISTSSSSYTTNSPPAGTSSTQQTTPPTAANASGLPPSEELKFKLSLKPRYGENRDYISLYVHNLNKKEIKYRLVFNVVNAAGEKKLTRRADARTHAPNESWGFPKFCQRTEVVDNPETMLPDGTLTVVCEIGGFKRITNRSDYQRVRDQFDPSVFATLSEDLSAYLEDMAHSDFLLLCKGEEFRCHKFILAARSDVFRAMFQHSDMKESVEGKLDLTDTEPDVVRTFLKFLYTDQLKDTSFATVSQLLPLAEKFNVKRLSTLCGQSLLTEMDVENVSEIAVLGSLYDVQLLKNRSIEFISQYPDRVLKTEGWLHLLKQTPEVCTNIICRLSKSSDKEVMIKSTTRSSLSSGS